ncbi:Mitochondrial-processing peptidase subunit alpha [Coemansia sp. RSA 2603]|nr:Mitochondrial-processing peptidase subunit alpha [Coemansia sp. RSA 2603]
MGRTPSNQGMAGLHPVSQVSFRLSQVPPSRHRKARMYIDRAESIEDDESIDGLLAEISNDEYNDMVRSDKDCRLDMEPSTPLTISSPMLSLSSMTSTAHISTPLSRDLPLPRNSDHSQRRVPLLNVSTNIPEQQPRKSILSPQFQHKSPETTDFGITCARVSTRLYTTAAAAAGNTTINARLKSDLKAAMKAKEKTKLTVIRGILSDILYAEKNQTGSTLFSRDSDADVAALIQRAIKQRRDSIQSYSEGGREDLVQEESAELAVLSEYLPEQLSSEQIEARVKQVIERLGVSGIKAMGAVMKEIDISPAEAPKSRVAEAVKRILGKISSLLGKKFKSTTAAETSVGAQIPLNHKQKATTEISADGQTYVTTFANGLRVVSENSPGHFTALGVYVDAGSRYESPSTSGYAHLMDRMAFRNSERFTSAESMAAIEKLGGSIMSSSSRECIMYQAAVFSEDVSTALGLLADTTLRPKYLEEELAELRETVPWELQDFMSKPDMFLPEKLHETAFRSGTLGNQLLCSPNQLNTATPDSLAAYHRRWYRPERIVVAAVGLEHADLVRLCSENGFADLAPASASNQIEQPALSADSTLSNRSWFNRMLGAGGAASAHSSIDPYAKSMYTGGTWLDAKPDTDFTQVYLGFKSSGIDDEKALYAYATLQMLLGGGGSFSAGGPGKGMYSRLYTRVLNQHAWIESCVAFHHCYTDAGLFGISASCRPRNEHALLDVVATEIEAVASGKNRIPSRSSMRRPYASQEGPTQAEVRRAKNQLKSNLLMNLESRMVQLEDLGRQIQVSGRKVPASTMIDHIENIRSADIAKAAGDLLENPATLLVQGKIDGVKKFYPQVCANHGIKI